ncbi:MAG: hypothetical protein A4E26_01852 [Methanobacterium sp. PtaU1.Bin097]|jgi:hypothetical protein|nr:MAG: hypothetical protein A4E26_01852 [Methanobacterium sp. PtaU1.Bin097]
MEVVETCFPEIKRFKLMTGFKSRKNIIFTKKEVIKIFKKEKYTDNLFLPYMEKIVS